MTSEMKNSANGENDIKHWETLCRNRDQLIQHITSTLNDHNPQKYVFREVRGTPAAVLIPLFFKEGEAHLLFTKRTDSVGTHKGQISFPGGRRDPEDENLLHTALRETEEEVGIRKLHILGETDTYLTNTHFLVTPYVGLFEHPFPYVVNEAEIERLIEVPLLHLLREDSFRIQQLTRHGYRWKIHYYYFNDDIIWGVTGFLLSNFLSLIFGLDRIFVPDAEKVEQ